MKKESEKFLSLFVSIIAPFLVISGFLKQYIYFIFFNVNISDFLTLNEILTSFLDDIVIFIFIPIILLPLIFESSSFDSEIIKNQNCNKKLNKYFPVNQYRSIHYPFYLGIIIYFIIKIVSQPFPVPLFNILSFMIPILAFMALSIYVIRILVTREYFKKNHLKGLLTYFLSVYLLIIVLSVSYEILTRKYYGGTYNVTVSLKEKGIITTPNYFYIGKTNNFIFIYNKPNNATDVYPTSEIDYLSFEKVEFVKVKD